MKKTRDGYKRTEAGYIPNDWGSEKLNNLAVKITDGTHKTPIYTDEGIPFLRVTDIQSKKVDWDNVKHISEEEHLELIKRCKPERGDILYSKNGTIGIPKIIDWDREFSIFVSLCLIKLDKNEAKINGKYLEQYLGSESCIEQIRLRAKQGTVTNLHLEEIRELIIPLPPLTEQQKIADILSTVDEQIEQTDALIEKTKELKKGLMQRLLTKGIGHTEFRDTEIGEIPIEWKVKRLGDLFKVSSGNFLSQKNIIPGEYPVYGGNGVTGYHNEYIFEEPKIVIGRVGAKCGCVCISVPKSWITDNALFIDKKLETFDDSFMLFLLEFLELNKYANQTAQPVISGQKIYEIVVGIPPVEEQKKIAVIIIKTNKTIEQYEYKNKKLKELKKALMQKLLIGKIRVKIEY